MPIYVYKAEDPGKSCSKCRDGFEVWQRMDDKKITKCPQCHNPVRKAITPFAQGTSRTGFDRRAKEQGFHKLERRDKGTYEKKY